MVEREKRGWRRGSARQGPPTRDSQDVQAVTRELRVDGMDCASCAATIDSALRQLDDVRDVRVDVIGGKVRVTHADRLPPGDLAAAIARVGYTVRGDDGAEGRHPSGLARTAVARSFWQRRGRLAMTLASGVFLALGLLADWLGGPAALNVALLALSSVAGGWFVVPRGLRAAQSLSLDMNFLMSIAAGGAWAIGERGEAAATLFLFAVAELLESHSMDRARNAIRTLMELSPLEARVRRDGQEVRVPVAQVSVGETVVVRPGEKLPVDGIVTGGRSSVNQAPITGESMPVEKETGADVFAGTLNQQGVLEIRSTRPASDTTLARIIHAVEEAQASRAPSQAFVDRFARIYTPAVVGLALLLALVPPLVGMGDWGTWLYRALAMLVVACPCALVISTPVSLVSGLTGAARGGVLIKGGAHLESLGRVRTVAFDKTGTLTQGAPTVTDVVPFGGRSEDEIVRLALGVERHSEHPLARAVMAYGESQGLVPPESSDFEALVGRGARAVVDQTVVYIGNERVLAQAAGGLGTHTPSSLTAVRTAGRRGQTAVLVAAGGAPLGLISIADEVRSDAVDALRALLALGIKRVVMLTGDNWSTACAVGARLGIDDIRAELLPEGKVRAVRELESRGERVAFVGDGVNDAPALAAATVGVAMGAAGTDVALETADVALMGDDLSKLAYAVRLSRKTVRIIKQNVALSIAIKGVFLVLAVGGWATLWMAVAADMGGSLLVVANGLRALRVRAP